MLAAKLRARFTPGSQSSPVQPDQRPTNSFLFSSLRFVLQRVAIASVLSSVSLCYSQTTSPELAPAPGLKPVPKLDINFLNPSEQAAPTNTDGLNFWRPASSSQNPAASSSNRNQSVNRPSIDFNQPTGDQTPVGYLNWSENNTAATSSANNAPTIEGWAREILAEGQQYASQDRWGEALATYQTALREHPESDLILRHRQLARIHVDLEQRLADRKYVQYALSDTADYAFDSYNEILSKIQAFHVDEPNWDQIAKHGINALLVAFENKDFQNKLGGPSFANTHKATAELLRVNLENYHVASRNALLTLVRDIARLVEEKTGLPQAATIHEFSSSAISSLDTYSGYLSPGHFEDVTSQIRGNFVGIGVELRSKDDHLEIVKVIPGGPADQARIRGGDKLLAVNGQLVADIGGDPAADLLKGSEGSSLTVVVETPEEKQYRLRITRRQIEIPSIEEAKIVDQQDGIAYIKLANFQKNTLNEFDYAMQTLYKQGMKALVLDLRENPGGVLDVSVAIANRFLTGGVIVQTRGRNPMENAVHPASAQHTWSLPLVVLVNEHSASASEILAAAIKDHRRGTIVGHKSFGKGSVQGIFPLASGRGGLRLTTAKFYSPTGTEIHMKGVSPDFAVQQAAKPALETVEVGTPQNEEDVTMVAAMKIARNKLSPTASVPASPAR